MIFLITLRVGSILSKKTHPCLAVIPARGGSKGIPKKNIYLLAGKPLLSYAVEALQLSQIDADIVVSTDSPEIMSVAQRHKGIYVIERPKEISDDSSKTEDALIDALRQMNSRFERDYHVVMTVQPTSPFRSPRTIKTFWQYFENMDRSFDALLTLNETRADYWVKDATGFQRLDPSAPRRRQDRKPLYVENSCLYATLVESLIKTESVLGYNAQGFLIEEKEALDINEPIDLLLAEAIMDKMMR